MSGSLSSNGSTSMASVCSSSLALMDAGVPISSPVAGIAGAITDESGKFVVPMIYKELKIILVIWISVAGTKDGVTALQMDIKVKV